MTNDRRNFQDAVRLVAQSCATVVPVTRQTGAALCAARPAQPGAQLVCVCPAIAAGIEFTLGEWSWPKTGCAAAGALAAAFLLSLFNDGSAGDSLFD
jgi:hypothetical protein